uniref:Uncharacterized protein n=1 Tax=Anguilla anguilla TaxID=7936 RepID=A0A0E9WXU1_ANGAN
MYVHKKKIQYQQKFSTFVITSIKSSSQLICNYSLPVTLIYLYCLINFHILSLPQSMGYNIIVFVISLSF